MKARQGSQNDLVKDAQSYLEAHSAEKFSLQTMAGALFVNGSYLLRTFRHHTGMTLLHCHHLIRCEKAGELLTRTDQSVSEIGETVGYVSSSHFTHVFKIMMGCTPSEYRRLHGGEEKEGEEP
ncbi:MAG: helix-turn-helix transcriptional regulator [Clostridia bacterium]|nr:helix-turn-helix transcriptional regulator [Clostridia bacterium]